MEADDASEAEAAATAAEEVMAEGEAAGTAVDEEEAAVAATDEAGAEATAIEDADATDTSIRHGSFMLRIIPPEIFFFCFPTSSQLLSAARIISRIGSTYSDFDIVRISSRSFFGKRLDWTVYPF